MDTRSKSQKFREDVIRPTLNELGYGGDAAEELLLGTAAHESHLKYRTQKGGGPALGLYQMEPKTHNDIWENFLDYDKTGLADKISNFLDSDNKLDNLENNDRYATGMARAHYLRVNSPLPKSGDLDGQAKYWKDHYNTRNGKGTLDKYKRDYETYVKD
ncbi:hypothetical protein TW85_13140 [Marinomonas sp. S3726]|nr:hypothetical protein TW85_13140 [Marinomonas sp. S3726]